KLKSTYVDSLPVLINTRTGRIHTSFNQCGSATGRISSNDPNLQNIPIRTEIGRKVRTAFVADVGGSPAYLMSGDYSQIELRVLAHLSQDPRLLAAFRNDEDIHTVTAADVFGVELSEVTPDLRRIAKTVNFGVIYGQSGFGLSQQVSGLSHQEANAFINSYFERYTGIKQYTEDTKKQARAQGYVETVLGRRRYIPEVNSANAQSRFAGERMAVNMPVQGSAADIIKIAMVRLHDWMSKEGVKSRMLLQIHDELLFEVPDDETEMMQSIIPEIMSEALALSVPIKVDVKIGRNWGEME
ncbi:MAG: DNA polymerase I, partial [Dehalococcoidia bacterium]|nr:DNA polymerase I [Dehalococcoidia bacterium]